MAKRDTDTEKWKKQESSPNEFEVHAEAYFRLKSSFYKVRGEYRLPNYKGYKGGICDIAIFDDRERLICLVEVKRDKNSLKSAEKKHQKDIYELCGGALCLYIVGIEQAKNAVSMVREALKKDGYDALD